jgi:oxygen-independent coproporphyrinogen-3 oxidase
VCAKRGNPTPLSGAGVSSGVKAAHLYVHVPFCARRCIYCDFSIAVRPQVPVDDYLRALELEWRARHAESELELDTLYFGGGTPSKLGAGIPPLLDLVRRHANLRDGAEVTLEANPEDVSPDAVRAWRTAGVNRVSLGVQTFDDAVLSWMHRTHDAETARDAVKVLRDEGIDNLSVDLIFAVPADLNRSWTKDIESALELSLPHLSVYGLTVEEHTPLGRWVGRRDVTEAREEAFEREFLEADAALIAAGFEHYEVSNYGQPGRHSRHNWAYWRRVPYAGLGPSAHEFDGGRRRWNADAYAHWVERLSSGEDPVGGTEELISTQEIAEEVYLGLRTSAGLMVSAEEREYADRWIKAGWATVGSDARLRLSSLGWLRLDSIATDLTALRSRY